MRMQNVSLLRLIAAIFVFVSHILFFTVGPKISDTYFPFYFGVNIFIFLSALLYSNKEIGSVKDFYKKQFPKLLIPPLLFVLIFFLLQLAVNPSIYSNFMAAIDPIVNLWYVIIITICYALIPVLNKIREKGCKNICFFVLIFAIIAEFVISVLINLQICVASFALTYLVLSKKTDNKSFSLFGGGGIFVLGGIVYAIIGIFVMPHFSGLALKLIATLKQYVASMMGLGFSICFLCLFKGMNCLKMSKFFNVADKQSYCFYIVQQSFMVGTFSVLDTSHLWVGIILVFVLTCIFGFVLQSLSSKMTDLICGHSKKM